MNNSLNKIRTDLYNIAIGVAKKSWTKILLVQIAQSVLMLTLLAPVIIMIFGNTFLSLFENMNDPIALQKQSQAIIQQMTGEFGTIISLVFLAIIVMLIITSWTINLFIIITDKYFKNRDSTFIEMIQKSINKNVFRILGASLLFVLLAIGLEIGGAVVIALFGGLLNSVFISVVLGFAFFVIALAFFMRFAITFPAIVIGSMSATEAMRYSYSKISWRNGFKYTAYAILGIILFYIIILLVTFLFSNTLGSSFFLGVFLMQFAQIVISSFLIAFVYAIFVGMYYRFNENLINDELNVEDHLISDL